MLTLKLIKEETDRVVKGLEKKHFEGAKEAIEKALEIDRQRRETQGQVDALLSESKKYASQIGQLMKSGDKAAAEAAKAEVAKLKEKTAGLQAQQKELEEELNSMTAAERLVNIHDSPTMTKPSRAVNTPRQAFMRPSRKPTSAVTASGIRNGTGDS